MKTCLKSDPDFDDCSREAVQQLFDALGPGKEQLHNHYAFYYIKVGDHFFTIVIFDNRLENSQIFLALCRWCFMLNYTSRYVVNNQSAA